MCIAHLCTAPRVRQDLLLTVLLDIASGMTYIHSKSIIHGCAFTLALCWEAARYIARLMHADELEVL